MKPALQKLNIRDWQVLATLAYLSQFDQFYSVQVIESRLISFNLLQQVLTADFITQVAKANSNRVYSRECLVKSLKKLAKAKILDEQRGRYRLTRKLITPLLSSARSTDCNRVDNQQQSVSKDKSISQEQYRQIFEFTSNNPWILAVAITGSRSVRPWAGCDVDYDLLVITSKNRLWIARTYLLINLFLFGKRPLVGGVKKILLKILPFLSNLSSLSNKSSLQQSNEWCFNLWLDSSGLSLKPNRQDLYHAYQLIQIRWLWGRRDWLRKLTVSKKGNEWDNLFELMFYHNSWMSECLEAIDLWKQNFKNTVPWILFDGGGVNQCNNVGEGGSRLLMVILTVLNYSLFMLSRLYLSLITLIPASNLNLNQAFLHHHKSAKLVLHNWQKQIQLLLSQYG